MELFTNLFRCCRETRKIPSAKDISVMSSTSEINQIKVCENQKQDENCNVNNIVKSNNVKLSSSKVLNNQSNRKELNVSEITFSNINVKESYKTLPEFDTEVMNTSELKLTGDLFWNKEIRVDRLGIKINKRKKRDGVSYFGTSEELDSHGNPINDFIVNLHAGQCSQSEDKSIFSLEYDKSVEHFVLKVINKEINVLHMINYDLFLPEHTHKKFLFGKIPVEIEVSEADVKDDMKLTIKVKQNNEWDSYEYSTNDAPITIGRSHSKININNSSISKSHVTIDYSNDNKMYYMRDNESTNGSFLVLENKDCLQIVSEMNFKIFETKFTIIDIE